MCQFFAMHLTETTTSTTTTSGCAEQLSMSNSKDLLCSFAKARIQPSTRPKVCTKML